MSDQAEYLRYVEMANSNGDPRIPILSFAEWLADGKPEQRVVNVEDDTPDRQPINNAG